MYTLYQKKLVNVMETKTRFIIQRTDGKPVNLHFEIVKSLFSAARFHTEEEANYFLHKGHYKPDNPELYEIVPVEISIEIKEEVEHEQSTTIPKDSESHAGH